MLMGNTKHCADRISILGLLTVSEGEKDGCLSALILRAYQFTGERREQPRGSSISASAWPHLSPIHGKQSLCVLAEAAQQLTAWTFGPGSPGGPHSTVLKHSWNCQHEAGLRSTDRAPFALSVCDKPRSHRPAAPLGICGALQELDTDQVSPGWVSSKHIEVLRSAARAHAPEDGAFPCCTCVCSLATGGGQLTPGEKITLKLTCLDWRAIKPVFIATVCYGANSDMAGEVQTVQTRMFSWIQLE